MATNTNMQTDNYNETEQFISIENSLTDAEAIQQQHIAANTAGIKDLRIDLEATAASGKAEVNAAVADFNAQIGKLWGSGDTTSFIDTFNEVITFLSGYTNSDTLKDLFSTKENVIEDLAAIRSGSTLGTTSIQPSRLEEVVNSINATISVLRETEELAHNDLTGDINDAVANLTNKLQDVANSLSAYTNTVSGSISTNMSEMHKELNTIITTTATTINTHIDTEVKNLLNTITTSSTTLNNKIDNVKEELVNQYTSADSAITESLNDVAVDVKDLLREVFPLVANWNTNAGTFEKGTSVKPSGTFTITRRGQDVASLATITVNNPDNVVISDDNKSFNGPTITETDTVYDMSVNQDGQTVILPSAAYKFTNFRYMGTLSSIPTDYPNTIKTLPKELSTTSTLEVTNLAANTYYLFAVIGIPILKCVHATTGGIINGCITGTCTLTQENTSSRSNVYSYILIPASTIDWSFKITN